MLELFWFLKWLWHARVDYFPALVLIFDIVFFFLVTLSANSKGLISTINKLMTSKDASSQHGGDDTVRTTPVRNPLNIERLSSWVVNHSSPVLQSLIFSSDGRLTTQDEHWLQERMQVKQFGKK